jgi:hypothetical protein
MVVGAPRSYLTPRASTLAPIEDPLPVAVGLPLPVDAPLTAGLPLTVGLSLRRPQAVALLLAGRLSLGAT